MPMSSIWYAGKAAWVLGDIVAPLYADEVVLEKKLKKVAEYTHKPQVQVDNLCDVLYSDVLKWRDSPVQAFKSMQVIDYCAHEGSPRFKEWASQLPGSLDTVVEDKASEEEGGEGEGKDDEKAVQFVRIKKYAAELAALLRDEAALHSEQVGSTIWKHRMNRRILRPWGAGDFVNVRDVPDGAAPPPPYAPLDHSAGESSASPVVDLPETIAGRPSSQDVFLSSRRKAPTLVKDSMLQTTFGDDNRSFYHVSYVADAGNQQRQVRRESRWTRERKIGSSASSSTWLEKCISGEEGGQLRAVKEIPKRISSRAADASEFVDYTKQLEAIAKFSQEEHRARFVQSYGWYENEDSILVSMEFHLFGDLRHFMWFKFPEEHVRLIISQILVALDLVHESGFVYGALEPSNIFVVDTAPRWWVKLGDFGLSKKAAEVESFRTNEKSLLYLPPEERKKQLLPPKSVDPDFAEVEAMREATRGKMIDVWATGALAFQLLTNQTLPEVVDGDSTSEQFPRQMLIDLGASEACIDLLDQLLSTPPDKRLSSSQALALPWIGRARG
ncbi:unnamed protein product [Clonostachys byssicola]|uniref:Protein kinase domain-containing protein n=1 Tax=Clonostachys byssicola TaxID=160290 RepID=A0A9N9U797_9HYPO|nr:unnamed protein product [Clonostachys byssicola]